MRDPSVTRIHTSNPVLPLVVFNQVIHPSTNPSTPPIRSIQCSPGRSPEPPKASVVHWFTGEPAGRHLRYAAIRLPRLTLLSTCNCTLSLNFCLAELSSTWPSIDWSSRTNEDLGKAMGNCQHELRDRQGESQNIHIFASSHTPHICCYLPPFQQFLHSCCALLFSPLCVTKRMAGTCLLRQWRPRVGCNCCCLSSLWSPCLICLTAL